MEIEVEVGVRIGVGDRSSSRSRSRGTCTKCRSACFCVYELVKDFFIITPQMRENTPPEDWPCVTVPPGITFKLG